VSEQEEWFLELASCTPNKPVGKNWIFYIQKPQPKLDQVRARPWLMALAWSVYWKSQSHLKPSQSHSFQAKLGQWSDAHPSILSKMSLHAWAAIRNTKTQGIAVVLKVVPVVQPMMIKHIPSVVLSVATTKMIANRTTYAEISASIPAATTVLSASRSALRTNLLKSLGPSVNKPTAPVVKQISSLKAETAESISHRREPSKSTTATITATLRLYRLISCYCNSWSSSRNCCCCHYTANMASHKSNLVI
jgi:hypothetical protein